MSIKEKLSSFLEQAGLCLAVLFYMLFSWHHWWSGVSPRLMRGSAERDAIHHAHLSIGATLFVIAIAVFLIWFVRPGAPRLERLKNAFSTSAATAISLFGIFVFANMLAGLGQAWAKAEHVLVLGVFELSPFLDWDWSNSGYMHSAFSGTTAALFSGIVFVFLYKQLTTYVKPGMAVALLLIVHLLVNLPKPPSLHPIAAFGTYVMTPAFYLTGLAIYCWANHRKWVYWPVYGLFILYFLYLPYFAFKALPPWHANTSDEIVLVEASEKLVPIRAAEDIFPDAESLAVATETAAWCRQCHTVTGDEHLLGPNLGGVFNRQAGTVEGYGRYSEAVISAGLDAVFWTRENLTKYLTDGPAFIPGNLMNQQTDLSDPVKMNQVLDYLEYISSK